MLSKEHSNSLPGIAKCSILGREIDGLPIAPNFDPFLQYLIEPAQPLRLVGCVTETEGSKFPDSRLPLKRPKGTQLANPTEAQRGPMEAEPASATLASGQGSPDALSRASLKRPRSPSQTKMVITKAQFRV